jgi:hypothetical protein
MATYTGTAYAWSASAADQSGRHSVFKLGSTIPVKFRLTGGCDSMGGIIAKIYVAKVSNNVAGSELEAVSTAAADSGNTFRNEAPQQYIFNLSTNAVGSVGTWQIRADLGDGASNRTVLVSLK